MSKSNSKVPWKGTQLMFNLSCLYCIKVQRVEFIIMVSWAKQFDNSLSSDSITSGYRCRFHGSSRHSDICSCSHLPRSVPGDTGHFCTHSILKLSKEQNMYILSTQSILKIVKRERYLHPFYTQYSKHCCKRKTGHLIVNICQMFIIFNSLYCKILHSNFFPISNYSKLLWMRISLLLKLDGHWWLTLFWWEGLRQSGVWRSCSGSLNYTRVSGDGTVWFLTAGVGKVVDHTANIWEIGVHWTSVVQQKPNVMLIMFNISQNVFKRL